MMATHILEERDASLQGVILEQNFQTHFAQPHE